MNLVGGIDSVDSENTVKDSVNHMELRENVRKILQFLQIQLRFCVCVVVGGDRSYRHK